MDDVKFIGPILATLLQVVIRFAAGRSIEQKNYLELFTEIPINIIFLSTSFMLVYLFSHNTTDKFVLILFVVYLIVSVIISVVYRKCKEIMDAQETRSKVLLFCFLVLFNYIVSMGCIYKASLFFGNTKDVKSEQSSIDKKIDKCK